jgi:outer membrane protein TolC
MRSVCPNRTLLLSLALLFSVVWPVRAGSPPDVQPVSYQPPVFQYGDGKISLLESVRLTLAHDPKLMLKGADVQLRAGLAQELKGAFDWVLKGEVSYDYREQELTDSVKQGEIDKRKNAEINERETCDELARQQQILTDLNNELASVGDGVTLAPPDVALEKQLQFFDILIQSSTDPTVRQGVVDEKFSFIQSEISAREVTVLNLDKGCTQAAIDRERLGPAPDLEWTKQGKLDVRMTKKFRSGVVLPPFITGQFDSAQFKGKKNGPEEVIKIFERDPETNEIVEVPLYSSLGPVTRTIDFGGKGQKDIYQAAVGFDVNIPMLRGRGSDAVAARENAAIKDFEAAELAVTHSAAEAVFKTATAYWQLLAAQQRVDILARSVELQRQLVDMTQALIDANEMPRAELPRALAGEANARSQYESARRDLVKARLELALSMGVGVESETNAPLAEGPFPPVPEDAAVGALDGAALTLGAVDRRYDSRSAMVSVEARKIETRGALLDEKGKLDLGLNASSRAIGEDSFSNMADTWANPSWRVRVQGEHVFGNNERIGRYEQSAARLDQQAIQSGDLDRNIRLNVVLAYSSLEEAIARYREALRVAELFQQTVDAEFEKLRLGSSTLIDAIQTEQQKTQAELSVVTALQEVAALLARLRFESGTLIEPGPTGYQIDEMRLISLPESSAPAGGAL